MKPIILLVSMLLLLGLTGACGKKKTALTSAEVKDIAVLTVGANLPELTVDQSRELQITLEWMDRDLVKNFKESGFRVNVLEKMHAYRPEMGKLLVIDVERFKAGNRAARAFVGFGAGSASLGLKYRLLDERGTLVSEWRDDIGSSKGPTYCAETLNRKAIEKVISLVNK